MDVRVRKGGSVECMDVRVRGGMYGCKSKRGERG